MVYSDEVAMMSFDCISWEVMQICDLENDGTNCSIVIKMASDSLNVVHRSRFAGTLNRPSSTSQ